MYYVKYKMPIFMDNILLELGVRRGRGSQVSAPFKTFLEKNENLRKKNIYQILKPNMKFIKKLFFCLEFSMVISKISLKMDYTFRFTRTFSGCPPWKTSWEHSVN
jgi:hypothetical protein